MCPLRLQKKSSVVTIMITVIGIYMKAPITVEMAVLDCMVSELLHLSVLSTYVTVVEEMFTVIPTEKSDESNMTLLDCMLSCYLLHLIMLLSTVPSVVPTGTTLITCMTTEMKNIYRPSGLMNISRSLMVMSIRLVTEVPCPLNWVMSGLVNGRLTITGTIAVRLTMVTRPEPLSMHPVTQVVTLPQAYSVKPSFSASY